MEFVKSLSTLGTSSALLVGTVLGLGAMVGTGACTIGDGGETEASPYESAALVVANPDGVADGVTEVEVVVSGEVGSRLTLVISGSATFLMPDEESTSQKTVFLTDETGEGRALARVVASAGGIVAVSFKPDPLRTPRSIEFHDVAVAVGAGTEVELAAGLVEHQLCVATSSAVGSIRTANYVGTGNIDTAADVVAAAPTGLDCPSSGAEPVGWNGYATLTWRTSDDSAAVDLSYFNDVSGQDTALATETVSLNGLAFPGYEVSTGTPVFGDFASVTLTVDYRATGALSAGPAAGVILEQRFIPNPGPGFLGSSSGGSEAAVVTGDDGTVTLFFDSSVAGTFAWFATLTGGENVQLDDLVIPAP